MATTQRDISGWFDIGVSGKRTHLIVVCDTFSYEDYPVYFKGTADEAREEVRNRYHGQNMQQAMEVYNLKKPKEPQLNTRRNWEY